MLKTDHANGARIAKLDAAHAWGNVVWVCHKVTRKLQVAVAAGFLRLRAGKKKSCG